jgi:hypothetical protein
MRRFAVPSVVLVCSLFAASAQALPRAAPQTALFSLRMTDMSTTDPVSVAGTGKIDRAKGLSSFEYSLGGVQFSYVMAAAPEFTIFVKNSLRGGWMQASAPDIIDPAAVLQLGTRGGRVVGTERMGGAQTTKYAMTLGPADARLLSPGSTAQDLAGGLKIFTWVDGTGAVRRLLTTLRIAWRTYVVDERLAAFGTAVHVTRPTIPVPPPPPATGPVEALLKSSLPSIEAYKYEHGTYTGMTAALLRATYESGFPDVVIVRATATTYCVEATSRNVTAHKSGPLAPIVAGRC